MMLNCIILLTLFAGIAHGGCVKDTGVTKSWAAAACADQKTRQACASIPGYCHWAAAAGAATAKPMATRMAGDASGTMPAWWGKGLVSGQKVFANYYGHGYFYKATVTSASGSKIGVKFADSDEDVVDRDSCMVLPAMSAGDMVWAREQTKQRWMQAKITGCSAAGQCSVQFYMPGGGTDDQQLMANINAIRPMMKFGRGDRVWCDYEAQDRWYRGTVTRVYTNSWYDVKLDNGMSSWQTRGSLLYLLQKADFMDVQDVVRGTVDSLLKKQRMYIDGEVGKLASSISGIQTVVTQFQKNVKNELASKGALVNVVGYTKPPTGAPTGSPTLFGKCGIMTVTGGPWPGKYRIQQPELSNVGPMSAANKAGSRDFWYNSGNNDIRMMYNINFGGWLLTNMVKTYLTKSSSFRPPKSATWHEFLGVDRKVIGVKCGASASPSIMPSRMPTASPLLEKCVALKVTAGATGSRKTYVLTRDAGMHNSREKWSRTIKGMEYSIYFGEGKLGDFWVYAMGKYQILVTHASPRFRPPMKSTWGPLAGEHGLTEQTINLKCLSTSPPTMKPTNMPTAPPTKSPIIPAFDIFFNTCPRGGRDIRDGPNQADCRKAYASQKRLKNIIVNKMQQKYVMDATIKCKMELWGAQGGNCPPSPSSGSTGGKGGYAVGVASFKKGDVLWFNVGQQGGNRNQGAHGYGGYGGGGYGHDSGNNGGGAGGGGASDIRLNGDTYAHRIIVAAGGGGARQENGGSAPRNGGHGGGLIGGDAGRDDPNQYCHGGGQTDRGTGEAQSGGTRGRNCNSRTMCPAYGSNLRSGTAGSYEVRSPPSCCISRFGIGASSHSNDAGGGGGGWWGGGAPGDNNGGCGGSSYGKAGTVTGFSTTSGSRTGSGKIDFRCGVK